MDYTPEQFIGRERAFVQLTETLAAGRSVCIVGPEGSGKTMLLQHLAHSAALVLDEAPAVIVIDLRSVRLAADLYGPLLRALGRSGDDELDAAQALAASAVPPLLLLDNLEQAGNGWTALLRSALRGWINARQLLLVAASAAPLVQAAPDMETTLVQITLTPMPEREARALISARLEAQGHTASDSLVREILLVAGGQPGRIVRAIELWQRAQSDSSDWRRQFAAEFPAPARVADEVSGWTPDLESSANQASATVSPAESRLSSIRLKPTTPPTYRAEDPSDFLIMVGLIAGALLVGLGVGGWWTGLIAMGLLLAVSITARTLVQRTQRDSVFTRAARLLPGFGRLVPPLA